MGRLRSTYRNLINHIFWQTAVFRGKSLPDFDSILIVSPHPDDEVLGCGGLLSHQNRQNKSASIVYLTQGENCDARIDPDTLKVERRKLTDKALQAIGQDMNKTFFLNYKDGSVSQDNPETEKLKTLVRQINPQAVFVTHRFEGWNDHEKAFDIMQNILADMPVDLYEYCVWFWYTTPFSKFFDIKWKGARIRRMSEKEYSAKKQAIEAYMNGKSREGIAYSGVLPKILLKFCSIKKELFFKSGVKGS